jgi:hypothetical protein
MHDRSFESPLTLHDNRSDGNIANRTTHNRVYQTQLPTFELFYLFHDDFDSQSADGTRKRVCPTLVRSIERWLSQFHDLEPIDAKYTSDRGLVSQHFNRWCFQIEHLPLLPDRNLQRSIASLIDPQAILVEYFSQHLLTTLRSNPQNSIVQRHWIAFYMQRCVVVAWRIWRKLPLEMQSLHLFREIVTFGYCRMPNFKDINNAKGFLKNFDPEKSVMVSGINHVKAYVNEQIEQSLLPDLRKILGDPYYTYSDLGVAARCSAIQVNNALKNINRSDTDIEEYEILWKCFRDYKKQTGIAVPDLVESDFIIIDEEYRAKSIHFSTFLNGTDIKSRIEQVGNAVHKFVFRPPISLDLPIGESGTLISIIPDRKQNLAEYQITKKKWGFVRDGINSICHELHPSGKKRNLHHKHLLWLHHGLDLKYTQIGIILRGNSRSDDHNAGTVSRLFSRSYKCGFDRIHTTLNHHRPSLSQKEINAAMSGLIQEYFDSFISQKILNLSYELGILEDHRISIAEEVRLIELLTNWFQQEIDLYIPADLFNLSIKRILNRYFYQPVISKLDY